MLTQIKNKEQYEAYLQKVYVLMQNNIQEDSKESDQLEALSILLENYEREHYPIEKPNPIEAMKFRLDQMCLRYDTN